MLSGRGGCGDSLPCYQSTQSSTIGAPLRHGILRPPARGRSVSAFQKAAISDTSRGAGLIAAPRAPGGCGLALPRNCHCACKLWPTCRPSRGFGRVETWGMGIEVLFYGTGPSRGVPVPAFHGRRATGCGGGAMTDRAAQANAQTKTRCGLRALGRARPWASKGSAFSGPFLERLRGGCPGTRVLARPAANWTPGLGVSGRAGGRIRAVSVQVPQNNSQHQRTSHHLDCIAHVVEHPAAAPALPASHSPPARPPPASLPRRCSTRAHALKPPAQSPHLLGRPSSLLRRWMPSPPHPPSLCPRRPPLARPSASPSSPPALARPAPACPVHSRSPLASTAPQAGLATADHENISRTAPHRRPPHARGHEP